MKKSELNAIVETLEGSISGHTLHLHCSSLAMMEYRGVMQENTLPAGVIVAKPKISKHEKELALSGFVNGKPCSIALKLEENQEVLQLVARETVAIEVDTYAEYVELVKEASKELLSTYAEGESMYMAERIPGWGKFRVKES